MITELKNEYIQTAQMLLSKKRELERRLPDTRGRETLQLEKRIETLHGMYLDTCFAIREMSKGRKEEIKCREADKPQEN